MKKILDFLEALPIYIILGGTMITIGAALLGYHSNPIPAEFDSGYDYLNN